MDIGLLMKGKKAWESFCRTHPRFPDFLQALRARGVQEGTEILISVTYPNGETLKSGIRVKKDDLELVEMLRNWNRQ